MDEGVSAINIIGEALENFQGEFPSQIEPILFQIMKIVWNSAKRKVESYYFTAHDLWHVATAAVAKDLGSYFFAAFGRGSSCENTCSPKNVLSTQSWWTSKKNVDFRQPNDRVKLKERGTRNYAINVPPNKRCTEIAWTNACTEIAWINPYKEIAWTNACMESVWINLCTEIAWGDACTEITWINPCTEIAWTNACTDIASTNACTEIAWR